MKRLAAIVLSAAALASPALARIQAQQAPAAPRPKFTPPPGVLATEIGRTVSRPAGKPGPVVDLFAFVGEAGSVLQAASGGVGAGGQVLTLHTPEGAEMLTAEGVDQVQLFAVLPRDGIYLLSVGRQNAARPYKLSLAADEPDLFQWSFRSNAGYEVTDANGTVLYSTCWTAPGSTLRYTWPDGRQRSLTVQRGGDGRWEAPSGQPGGYSFTTQLVAGVFIRTPSAGKVQTWSLNDAPPRLGAYRDYLCR